jgi:GT2 family glycosyltransferase
LISAIVPTLGARARLERHLPSVCASLEAAGQPWEVIVVDDGAGLETAPAPARLVSPPRSGGYGPAVNAGAAAAAGDLLLILNDDVELEPSTVRLLRDALLAEEGVFAVAPRIVSPLARCGDEGGKSAAWRAGLLEIAEAPAEAPHPTLYAVGCCFLCRRQAFLGLGGYDDVYAPFFWEDVDLGYRAWRSGLASLHVPGARCQHEGSATIGARPMSERQRAFHRSAALFHLRNLQRPILRAGALGAWAAQALFDGRPAIAEGLAEALTRFASAGRRRTEGLSDEEILARVSGA